MRVALLSGPAVSARHGSGVQILRLFEGARDDVRHLYWRGTAGPESDLPHAHYLKTLPGLKRLRGGRLMDLAERALGVAWWDGDRVNAAKLERLLRDRGWGCDVAYVCVARETEAREALSILDVLDRPYVVHLMDLCHDEGLDPERMPGYRRLLGEAATVFAASAPMAEQARKVRADNVRAVALAKTVGGRASPPPDADGRTRLILLGSLGSADNPALALLDEAWPALERRVPGFECLYMGQHVHLLPSRLRERVTCPGRLDLETFERKLLTGHLAYLPSPRAMDCYGRFAPVARIVDYFMAGLPVLYSIAKGSAPEGLLREMAPATARVDSPSGLVDAAARLAAPAAWQAAGDRVRAYAETHFDLARLRDEVMTAIEQATSAPRGAGAEPSREDVHAKR